MPATLLRKLSYFRTMLDEMETRGIWTSEFCNELRYGGAVAVPVPLDELPVPFDEMEISGTGHRKYVIKEEPEKEDVASLLKKPKRKFRLK